MKVYTVEARGNTGPEWFHEDNIVCHIASTFDGAVDFIRGPGQNMGWQNEEYREFQWVVCGYILDFAGDDILAGNGRAVANFDLDGTVKSTTMEVKS